MTAQTIDIADAASGAVARVLVSQGFNLFQLSLHSHGEPVEVLWAEEGFEHGDRRASSSGIPLLFPYAGRIQGMSFPWKGRDYPQEADDHRGNAIHGFVYTRPWRVIEHEPGRVVGEFQASVDDPALAERWPADFRISAAYELKGNSLLATFTLANPGETALPFSFGAHPYFRLPLVDVGGETGSAQECRIHVPTAKQWELEDMLPSGRSAAGGQAAKLAAAEPLKLSAYDDVFGELAYEEGICTTSILDEANNRRLNLLFDDTFRECVVYTPPHREAICLEPYTAVPDAFRLTEAGIDAGMRTLVPGDSLTCQMEVRLETL